MSGNVVLEQTMPEQRLSKQPQSKRRSVRTLALLGIIGIGVAAGVFLKLSSAPRPDNTELGRQWSADQQISMDDIDHSAFDALLKKYVDDDGYVNYTVWKQSSDDQNALESYLAQLSRASTTKPSSRNARLAFWINAYNALTLKGILQVYPTSSIRNHTSRFGGYNIWKDLHLRVGDSEYSLNQMEHQILRKMHEPRIHFAIVCASVGCPRLKSEAYTARNLDRQLAENATDFFSRPVNFQFDAATHTLAVSSILDWFGEDFGETHEARFEFLKPYLPAAARQMAVAPQTQVRYLSYDWNLNDQAHKPASE